MRVEPKAPRSRRPSTTPPLFRTSLMLSKVHFAEAAELAQKNDCSISRIVRIAMSRYLAQERAEVV